jgi:hypothetical protein
MWDDTGREWRKQYGWLTYDEIESHLPAIGVVLHEFRGPILWLDRAEARALWTRIRPHTQDGQNAGGATSDERGVAYTAAIWTREHERILLFQAHH